MEELDAIHQRIVGVLVEKELSVPDSYPLTESVLLAGCNQKSNRDPEMSLEQTDIHDALLALRGWGWVVRIDGGRSARFRHSVEEKLNLGRQHKPILAELLIRGPQAPGSLKSRLVRMGQSISVDEISDLLDELARRPQPLVEQMAKLPRERDCRWRHLLGESAVAEAAEPSQPAVHAAPDVPAPTLRAESDLEQRVAKLEREVAELRALLE